MNYIIDPVSFEKHSIFSITGKTLLKNYIKYAQTEMKYQKGGAGAGAGGFGSGSGAGDGGGGGKAGRTARTASWYSNRHNPFGGKGLTREERVAALNEKRRKGINVGKMNPDHMTPEQIANADINDALQKEARQILSGQIIPLYGALTKDEKDKLAIIVVALKTFAPGVSDAAASIVGTALFSYLNTPKWLSIAWDTKGEAIKQIAALFGQERRVKRILEELTQRAEELKRTFGIVRRKADVTPTILKIKLIRIYNNIKTKLSQIYGTVRARVTNASIAMMGEATAADTSAEQVVNYDILNSVSDETLGYLKRAISSKYETLPEERINNIARLLIMRNSNAPVFEAATLLFEKTEPKKRTGIEIIQQHFEKIRNFTSDIVRMAWESMPATRVRSAQAGQTHSAEGYPVNPEELAFNAIVEMIPIQVKINRPNVDEYLLAQAREILFAKALAKDPQDIGTGQYADAISTRRFEGRPGDIEGQGGFSSMVSPAAEAKRAAAARRAAEKDAFERGEIPAIVDDLSDDSITVRDTDGK